MTVTVQELEPGDLVTQGGQSAVFIAHAPHPRHPGLRLVIWKLDDGTWSLDALSAEQEAGDVTRGHPLSAWEQVQAAFRD